MNKTRWWIAVVVLAGVLSLGSVAQAQTGGGYDLTWNTIDSGGGLVSGGAYTLDGTIGQWDAGHLSGGGYTLSGGFWNATVSALMDYFVYLPVALK